MNAEQIYEVVTKLVGNIRPQGDSSRDRESNANLRVFIEVFKKMHIDIDDVAYDFRKSHESSVKEASNIAEGHLKSMGITD